MSFGDDLQAQPGRQGILRMDSRRGVAQCHRLHPHCKTQIRLRASLNLPCQRREQRFSSYKVAYRCPPSHRSGCEIRSAVSAVLRRQDLGGDCSDPPHLRSLQQRKIWQGFDGLALGRPAGQQCSRDRFDAWTAGGSEATNAHTETGLFPLIPG
jgi:hypothetical protein